MIRPSRAPVVIVGAGPAGASLALRLARRGLEVELLDARSFPRSKPCGDCLSPGAEPLLRELGVMDALRRHRPARLRGWRILTPAGRAFGQDFSPSRGRGPAHGLALPREELDAVLLKTAREAGARFVPNRRAFRLLRRDGRVTGVVARDGRGRERRHPAALVVGADGLRSTVARRAGGVDRGRRRRLALVGRFLGDPSPGTRGELRLLRPAGVVGIAPIGGGRMNVTVVVPADRAPEISQDRDAVFGRAVERAGLAGRLAPTRRAVPLEITGPFEVTPRRLCGPGFLLVGDAAGYFDPLTGQGIYRALATARLAARLVPGLLEAGDTPRRVGGGGPRRDGTASTSPAEAALLHRYEREVRGLLDPGRRVQRAVDATVARPGAMEVAGAALAAAPELAGLLLEVTGDRLPPSALLRPDRLASACFTSMLSGAGREM